MSNFRQALQSELELDKKNDNFSYFKKVESVVANTPLRSSAYYKFRHKVAVVLQQLGIRKSINIEKYLPELEYLYNKLETQDSKRLLIQLLAYMKLGYHKVKLPLCNDEFINGILEVRKLADCSEAIYPNFLSWKLCKFDLKSLGYDITLFFEASSVYIEFVLKPYEYNKNGVTIRCEENDYVIDAGGCWGDTALNFASQVGDEGKVHTFEFIPGNVEIMKKNLSLNPTLEKRIEIVQHPVWNVSDEKMYCNDFGPASTIKSSPSETHNIEVSAITIDDFVKRGNVKKIDFIKMDIEGAETFALKGAIETIKQFKPKLAICVYHSLTDFFEIPKLIDDLGLGYKFYLDHYTHAGGETVLYAQV